MIAVAFSHVSTLDVVSPDATCVTPLAMSSISSLDSVHPISERDLSLYLALASMVHAVANVVVDLPSSEMLLDLFLAQVDVL